MICSSLENYYLCISDIENLFLAEIANKFLGIKPEGLAVFIFYMLFYGSRDFPHTCRSLILSFLFKF